MGRGRAKAKQTKVARELKYGGPQTDFARLQAELGNSTAQEIDAAVADEDPYAEDPYAKYYDEDEDEQPPLLPQMLQTDWPSTTDPAASGMAKRMPRTPPARWAGRMGGRFRLPRRAARSAWGRNRRRLDRVTARS